MLGRLKRSGLLSLSSNPGDVDQLLDSLEKMLQMSSLDEMSAFHLRCAVVEVVNNCIQHAYQNEAGHPIEIIYFIAIDRVRVGVSDRGPAFLGPVEVLGTGRAEESGRGFEIINAWASSLHFERKNKWNTCWLEQKPQKA
jgi:serine/threonine-protein kinase RsbW